MTLYEQRDKAMSMINQMKTDGKSLRAIANRLRIQGYKNTKGYGVKAQDVSNFLYLSGKRQFAAPAIVNTEAVTEAVSQVQAFDWRTEAREVMSSNLSNET